MSQLRRAAVVVVCSVLAATLLVCPAPAHGPADNLPDAVRPIPPAGNELAPADRRDLEAGLAELSRRVDAVSQSLKTTPELQKYLPDVQIYVNAVRYPLTYHEHCEMKLARRALADGIARAKQLRDGKTPWTTTTGPRGYVSKIDGSVQPYVLSVPTSFSGIDTKRAYRLDVSCHGRDENLTELKFISSKPPPASDHFAVNLYGRYCNANKFAGEIDCLEVLDALRSQYPIDPDRILMIGFSMGGAACWQFAVHYTDLWAAASPGAGFAETRDFLHGFQHEDVDPAWYEKVLWHWYDCTDWAANLANLPTIAYAGELDGQKQASDVMAAAMAAEGLELQRIIGPNTKHAYEPSAKRELDRRLDELLAKGRNPFPTKLRFTTWTLRHNRMFWITVDALQRQWDRARVDAEVTDAGIVMTTQNVDGLTLSLPIATATKWLTGKSILIDGTTLPAPSATNGETWTVHLARAGDAWAISSDLPGGLRKRHGLQGPIDDAFLDRFIIVRPTGKPLNEKLGAWCTAECAHAIDHWRKQFRGEAIVKNDADVTADDIASANLVLFGDPSSNRLLGQMLRKLPLKWDDRKLEIAGTSVDAGHHIPALIYPNPLNPSRYVVLNSSFTFREYDYLNNARQIPKLPDYAVFDTATPPTSRAPASVVAAGFFDERWQPQADGGKSALEREIRTP